MGATSYFSRLLKLAVAELSEPVTAVKLYAAWNACAKKISRSRINYQFKKENE